jgi:hypothetical protein
VQFYLNNKKLSLGQAAPFALYGDVIGDYLGNRLPEGVYVLKAEPITGDPNKSPTQITFTIIDRPYVESFTLVNADTDQDIEVVEEGAIFNLSVLPCRNVNIRANVAPDITGSVAFKLNGNTALESTYPYAYAGDRNGNYNAWTPAVGKYALKATPYTAAAGKGKEGEDLKVSFEVVDGLGSPTGKADLLITDVTLQPAVPAPGDTVIFTAHIRNKGNGATPDSVVIGVAFWVNGQFVSCFHSDSSALAATAPLTGISNDCGVIWVAGNAGSYKVEAIVDDVNRIAGESNETNNNFIKTFVVANVNDSTTIDKEGRDNALLSNDIVGVYPNPAYTYFNLAFQKKGTYEVVVTDITGKVYLQKNIVADSNKKTMIDTKEFSSGMYFLNITSEKGKSYRKKLMIGYK